MLLVPGEPSRHQGIRRRAQRRRHQIGARISFSLAVVTLLCFGTAFAGAGNEDLPNFHKIDDGLYRGGQPTALGLKSLADLGVKTVIDLRGPEHSEADERRLVEAAGMRYVSIPMKGMRTPADRQISEALAVMNDPNSQPVFVHCRRGADRTGVVVACYRIQHDHWDSARALREAMSYGMRWFEFALRNYVKGFAALAQSTAPGARYTLKRGASSLSASTRPSRERRFSSCDTPLAAGAGTSDAQLL